MLITSLSIIQTYINIYFISKKNIIIILLLSAIIAFSTKIQDNLISTIIQFILLNMSVYFIFKISIDKCVISVVLFYIILFICDVFSLLLVKIINIDLNTLTTFERKVIGTSIVIFTIIVISKINPIITIFQRIIDNITIKIFSYISISIIAISISYMFIYYNVLNKNLDEIIINIAMIALIICIFIKLSLERINKQNITKEYDKMSEYVKIYEEIIEKDRIRRHENKNQLITIKGMISDKDKKAHEYIDSLIDDNSDKTYKWIGELKNIPIGGLKGLLFYKVNAMRENNIDVSLTISRSLEESKFSPDFILFIYSSICLSASFSPSP